ncbi:unnamed protein product [Urochloa humidicola]
MPTRCLTDCLSRSLILLKTMCAAPSCTLARGTPSAEDEVTDNSSASSFECNQVQYISNSTFSYSIGVLSLPCFATRAPNVMLVLEGLFAQKLVMLVPMFKHKVSNTPWPPPIQSDMPSTDVQLRVQLKPPWPPPVLCEMQVEGIQLWPIPWLFFSDLILVVHWANVLSREFGYSVSPFRVKFLLKGISGDYLQYWQHNLSYSMSRMIDGTKGRDSILSQFIDGMDAHLLKQVTVITRAHMPFQFIDELQFSDSISGHLLQVAILQWLAEWCQFAVAKVSGQIVGVPYLPSHQLSSILAVQQLFLWDPGGDQYVFAQLEYITGLCDPWLLAAMSLVFRWSSGLHLSPQFSVPQNTWHGIFMISVLGFQMFWMANFILHIHKSSSKWLRSSHGYIFEVDTSMSKVTWIVNILHILIVRRTMLSVVVYWFLRVRCGCRTKVQLVSQRYLSPHSAHDYWSFSWLLALLIVPNQLAHKLRKLIAILLGNEPFILVGVSRMPRCGSAAILPNYLALLQAWLKFMDAQFSSNIGQAVHVLLQCLVQMVECELIQQHPDSSWCYISSVLFGLVSISSHWTKVEQTSNLWKAPGLPCLRIVLPEEQVQVEYSHRISRLPQRVCDTIFKLHFYHLVVEDP